MAVGYRWYVGDLRTGKIYRQVDLSNTRWSTSFDYNVAGSVEGSFALRSVDPNTGERVWPTARADTAPAKSFLAVSYVDALGTETFLEAGPIWARRYNDQAGNLQIGGSGLASYYDRRKPIIVEPGTPDDGTFSTFALGLRGGTLTDAAKYLIMLASSNGFDPYAGVPVTIDTIDDPEPYGDLIVDEGTDVQPSAHEYHVIVRGYELPWIGTLLKQITDREGGPEIQFVPRRKADDPRYIEWLARVGEPDAPMLTQVGPPWQFDRTTHESDVRDIDTTTDGKDVATRMWGAGEGEAEGRPIMYVDNTDLIDQGWPSLDGEVKATDAQSDSAILAETATEDLAKASRPREAWSITVSRDGRPNVGQYRPGDWANLRTANHDYLPDGTHELRTLAMGGNGDSGDVTVTVAESLEVS